MHVCGVQYTRTRGMRNVYIIYMYAYMYDIKYWLVTYCRWDMTIQDTMYNSPPSTGKARTLESLRVNHQFSRPAKHLGSKYPPLIQLEPSQYVLDELHLLLRVVDVLLRNVINLADHIDQTTAMRHGRAGTHIISLETMVKACGVHFKISIVSDSLNEQHMLL